MLLGHCHLQIQLSQCQFVLCFVVFIERQMLLTWTINNAFKVLPSFSLFQAFSTVGTPDYIAPEVLLKKGYGTECDWLVSLNDEWFNRIFRQYLPCVLPVSLCIKVT